MTALTKDEYANRTKLTVDQKLQCLRLAIDSLKQSDTQGVQRLLANDVVGSAETFADFMAFDSVQQPSTFCPDSSNTDTTAQ